MLPATFELKFQTIESPQTHTLDCAATASDHQYSVLIFKSCTAHHRHYMITEIDTL